MSTLTATARACSNIAFVKYWGNRDDSLRLPANGSISMNLAGLETITTVQFDPALPADRLILGGQEQGGGELSRVSRHLDHIRALVGTQTRALVVSHNNFPAGTGIASSASAFAALTVAACAALQIELPERQLSALARLGSGSACRSIPSGYVEWHAGDSHEMSFAETLAPPDHWPLVDLVAIVSRTPKAVGSTRGHAVAPTSPLQPARVADAARRLRLCREAILSRDFESLARVIELDALMMHAVMMTSSPTLIYWLPATLRIMQAVQEWRQADLPAAFTIDAGPNVHVITTAQFRDTVAQKLAQVEGTQDILHAAPGEGARQINEHLPLP